MLSNGIASKIMAPIFKNENCNSGYFPNSNRNMKMVKHKNYVLLFFKKVLLCLTKGKLNFMFRTDLQMPLRVRLQADGNSSFSKFDSGFLPQR